MTRKRFVKLAMSRGVPRNDAEVIAQMASGVMSYDELIWVALELRVGSLQRALEGLAAAFSQTLEPISRAAEAFNAWLSGMDPEVLEYLKESIED